MIGGIHDPDLSSRDNAEVPNDTDDEDQQDDTVAVENGSGDKVPPLDDAATLTKKAGTDANNKNKEAVQLVAEEVAVEPNEQPESSLAPCCETGIISTMAPSEVTEEAFDSKDALDASDKPVSSVLATSSPAKEDFSETTAVFEG